MALNFGGEYNRTFDFYGEVSAIGEIELNNLLAFRGGFLYGKTSYDFDLKAFFNAGISPFLKTPLVFSVSWIYYGLPEYDVHMHSILPLVSLNGRIAGVSVGVNLRFTSFLGESAQFESILTYSVYLNFFNNKRLRIGITIGTFDDFNARNLGAHSLKVYSAIHINGNWSILGDVELMQSGGDGFSTVFYGIAWRGGVKFSW